MLPPSKSSAVTWRRPQSVLSSASSTLSRRSCLLSLSGRPEDMVSYWTIMLLSAMPWRKCVSISQSMRPIWRLGQTPNSIDKTLIVSPINLSPSSSSEPTRCYHIDDPNIFRGLWWTTSLPSMPNLLQPFYQTYFLLSILHVLTLIASDAFCPFHTQLAVCIAIAFVSSLAFQASLERFSRIGWSQRRLRKCLYDMIRWNIMMILPQWMWLDEFYASHAFMFSYDRFGCTLQANRRQELDGRRSCPAFGDA